jgi:hypothetical protein
MNIPETLKMPSLSGLGKRPQGILRNQSKRIVSLVLTFESSFQNCFWNVFSTSDLSQICKIRNVRKLPVPSQGILLSRALKMFLKFKNIILEEDSTNSKIVLTRRKGFHGFGTSCMDILKP